MKKTTDFSENQKSQGAANLRRNEGAKFGYTSLYAYFEHKLQE